MSEITEPEGLDEETPEISLSEVGERDAALADVLREQTEKAEVEAHTGPSTGPAAARSGGGNSSTRDVLSGAKDRAVPARHRARAH